MPPDHPRSSGWVIGSKRRRCSVAFFSFFTAQLEIRKNLALRLHSKTTSSHMDSEEEPERLKRSPLSSGNHAAAAAAAVFASLHIAVCSRCVGGGGRGREEGGIRRSKHHLQVGNKTHKRIHSMLLRGPGALREDDSFVRPSLQSGGGLPPGHLSGNGSTSPLLRDLPGRCSLAHKHTYTCTHGIVFTPVVQIVALVF